MEMVVVAVEVVEVETQVPAVVVEAVAVEEKLQPVVWICVAFPSHHHPQM